MAVPRLTSCYVASLFVARHVAEWSRQRQPVERIAACHRASWVDGLRAAGWIYVSMARWSKVTRVQEAGTWVSLTP